MNRMQKASWLIVVMQRTTLVTSAIAVIVLYCMAGFSVAKAGFGVSTMVFYFSCMVTFFFKGLHGTVDVEFLALICFLAGMTGFLVHALTILILYGRDKTCQGELK